MPIPQFQPLCTLVILLSLSPLQAQQWDRFRGPNGTGRAVEGVSLPQTWSEEENVRWKTPILKGSSSPILNGDTIFLTGYSGYATDAEDLGQRGDLKLHVQAFSFETGKQIWDYNFSASANEQEATRRVIDHGYASPTACTDGKAVYAWFGPSGMVALDLQGNLLWKRELGSKTAGFGAAASPITWQNLVIMNASIEAGTLFALDKQTGKIVWELEEVNRAWTTPALAILADGGTELVLHYKDEARGIDPETGEVLWNCRGIPDYIVPVPIVDGDIIYFSGGRQNRTMAIRAGGRGDVTETHKLWEVARGANVTTPLLHDGHLYWSHDKAFALCMSAETGDVLDQTRFENGERVYASVVYGDEKLFMTQRNGVTLVLRASPEYNLLSENQLGDGEESFNATPAIHENSLLFRSTKHLIRVEK
ncbi:MAG: PQQ-binding-like beta-propeller repeat protein [Planctomycetota bacterium]